MVELHPHSFAQSAGLTGGPLRLLHHMACTGGTVISKAVALLPNVVLASEIDPLSTIMIRAEGKAPFAPSDLIAALRYNPRPVSDAVFAASFSHGAWAAQRALAADGQSLVLRDHAHSQFCTKTDFTARPSLYEMLRDSAARGAGQILSLMSIRHPLESFLSLHQNNWRHFAPFTLAEYSRRYLGFLARHPGVTRIRYEDFTQDPGISLAQIAAALALPYQPQALGLISLARLSGDSGRSGDAVAPRAPKALPEAVRAACEGESYRQLCQELGYPALPQAYLGKTAAQTPQAPAADQAPRPALPASAPSQAMPDALAALHSRLAAAEAERDRLGAELRRLYGSQSWRLTAPLRRLRLWLR